VEPLKAGNSDVDRAVSGLREGKPVILPTDTVYGLCVRADSAEAVRGAYRLKGREERQPSALVAASVEQLLECVPELRGRIATVMAALLPGPFTLVVPNPGGRFPWLAGANPQALGVRVPELPSPSDSVLAQAGAVMATSANLTGGRDPARLEEVHEQILAACAAAIDGGRLPGTPSTVVDLTGDKPNVLREGAVPGVEALERARAALATA
jgi:L-threonylcarbamoyladenylate synthase